MKKLKNVISLFDGMSCAQIALNQSNIEYENYFASEIDKYGQIVSKANFPNTKYIGDVRFVSYKNGILTTQFGTFNIGKVDLLCGGSPCQSFSFAGKRKGMSTKDEQEILTLDRYLQLKAEEYEFEGQSYLFWEYMRILTEIQAENPDVKFLLENVIMGEKWQTILTRAIGIQPIEINAALVSAQNRRRLFWTNIGAEPDGLFGDLVCKIPQPKDKGILLKDILEQEVDGKYFLSQKMINAFYNHKERHDYKGTGFGFKPKIGNEKRNALRANAALCSTDNTIIINNPDKSYCIDANYFKGGTIQNYIEKSRRQLISYYSKIRRLTPIECERLQCVDDNYTSSVSDSQRYKMLGNGWNIQVINHIFSYL